MEKGRWRMVTWRDGEQRRGGGKGSVSDPEVT